MASGGTLKTKEWLKTQLVNHGVSLPASSAKKEEYQRLYDEQVAPLVANSTEFSSDDDAEPLVSNEQSSSRPPSAQKVVRASPVLAKAASGVDAVEKRRIWVDALDDQNLFDALKANRRNVGPVVDTTRTMYRKTLLDLLMENEKETLGNIEEYLAENPDAKEQWRATGSDLHALNGVSNGNSAENGFSDTDDDEALETASRTSKSSRASSKRATPVRNSRNSTPSVSGTPTPKGITSTTGKGSTSSSTSGSKASTPSISGRTSVDSRSKARRVSTFEDHLDLESMEAESFSSRQTHTPTPPDPLLYARVLPSTTPKYSVKQSSSNVTTRRSTYETYEGMRNSIPEEIEEDVDERIQPRHNLKKRWNFILILKYVALLITIVAVPLIAYYVWGITQGSDVGQHVEQKDELDEILEKIAAEEKLVKN